MGTREATKPWPNTMYLYQQRWKELNVTMFTKKKKKKERTFPMVLVCSSATLF